MYNKFIKPMTIGEWLDASIKILWNNLKSYLGIALFSFVVLVIMNFAQPSVQSPSFLNSNSFTELVVPIIIYFGVLIIYLLSLVITGGALVHLTDRIIHGEKISITASFKASLNRFWTLLGSGLIIFLGFLLLLFIIFLLYLIIGLSFWNFKFDGPSSVFAIIPIVIGVTFGLFLLFVPGLVLSVYTILRTPAVMLENLGPWQAIKRSYNLIKENWWRTLGYGIVVTILGAIFVGVFSMISGGFTFALTISKGPEALLQSKFIIAAINSFSSIPYLITMPFTYIAMTLMYYSLRSEKEGFDIEGEIEKLTEV